MRTFDSKVSSHILLFLSITTSVSLRCFEFTTWWIGFPDPTFYGHTNNWREINRFPLILEHRIHIVTVWVTQLEIWASDSFYRNEFSNSNSRKSTPAARLLPLPHHSQFYRPKVFWAVRILNIFLRKSLVFLKSEPLIAPLLGCEVLGKIWKSVANKKKKSKWPRFLSSVRVAPCFWLFFSRQPHSHWFQNGTK